MAITYKSLPKIRFPVYLLPTSDWCHKDGLLFLESKILDDTNMSGTSLGLRRLQTPHKDNLAILRRSVNSLPALLKQNTKYFIDYNGVPFEYQKTKFVALKYHRINEVASKGSASLLYVEGSSVPFTVPRPPPAKCSWVGILHLYGLPWMLYEYSTEKLASTRRKV